MREQLDQSQFNFSVLLSVYHKDVPTYLDQALLSIHNQTLQPDEVVIVKDGMISAELNGVIDRFKQLYTGKMKEVQLDKRKGLANALNEGLKHCSFEWVARMDSDDICYPERFEKQIGFLKVNSDIDVVGAFIKEFSETVNDKKMFRTVPLLHEEIFRLSKIRCPINHVSVIYRKSKVFAVGGYETKFGSFEDYPLWVKMLQNGSKFHNMPDVLMHVRVAKSEMIKRRRGLKYAGKEWRLANYLFNIQHINIRQYCIWIFFRIPSRLIPSKLLYILYQGLLRKSVITP